MSLNMRKEIRAEIRANKQALKKIWRDDKVAYRQLVRESFQHDAAKRRIVNLIHRQQKRVNRISIKIQNRIAILEGRLS